MSDELPICVAKGCANMPVGTYDWPGKLGLPACEEHIAWAKQVGAALGFDLRITLFPRRAEKGKRLIEL